MSKVPRNGFFESYPSSSAYLGRGPDFRTGPRLAYGPGPGGSFDYTGCAEMVPYHLPPLHVYKERTTYFHLPPRVAPDKWKAVHRTTPAWAERLTMRPGQQLAMRNRGSPNTWGNKELVRPNSAGALLEQMERVAGPKLATSQSALALLRSAPPDARIGVGCCGVYFIPQQGSKERRPPTATRMRAKGAGPIGEAPATPVLAKALAPAPAPAPAPELVPTAMPTPVPAPAPAPTPTAETADLAVPASSTEAGPAPSPQAVTPIPAETAKAPATDSPTGVITTTEYNEVPAPSLPEGNNAHDVKE